MRNRPCWLQHCVPYGCLAEHAIRSNALLRLPPGTCRGYNDYGQLGDGSNIDSLEPVPVLGGLAFADITAGSGHTCGLLNNGSVACWVGAPMCSCWLRDVQIHRLVGRTRICNEARLHM